MVPVRIENRAQLIYLLTEAAELEHEILCCYLFASFSMKDSEDEGLTSAQLEAVRRWRSMIGEIVVQEMTHLASACNLLTAIGGTPHLVRPNLPTASRAYPPAFRLQLVPFSFEAVQQFILLEQPEIMQEGGGREDYRAQAVPLERLGDIFSSERNFSTVGELYRGIEDGVTYLSQKLGEANLFVGAPEVQTSAPFFVMPGLSPVHDLASALEAIQVIVEQGEGAGPEVEDSHYRRFLKIHDEYATALVDDPGFQPARPVLRSPYATLPNDLADGSNVAMIDDHLAADACNLFDGCYELMVQILGRLFAHSGESDAELGTLADIAVGLMIEVVQPLGRAVTLLPAGPSHPGQNAGPSFRLSRTAAIPAHSAPARAIFHERLIELMRYCQFVQVTPGAPRELGTIRGLLAGYAERLAVGAN